MTERLLPDAEGIARAAVLLRAGELVAFPTETVYGLGARADDPAAVRAIFAAKGRPEGNPLIVHVPSLAAARALAEAWPDAAERLGAAFWPGPLTLVVRRREGAVAAEVAAGGPTVALRVPEHAVARALLEAAGVPVAAPSANRSTSISPTTADHVLKTLEGRIAAVVDGGPTGFGIESTIVDVSRSPAVLLRPGALALADVEPLAAVVDPGALVVAPGETAASPGQHARHYAPKARMTLLPAGEVRAEVERLRAEGVRVGALERAPGSVGEPPHEVLPDDPEGFAAGLYAALHRLEDAGCEVIVAASVPRGARWDAVRDRVRRASA